MKGAMKHTIGFLTALLLVACAGATNPTEALPGTIRGDYGRDWGLAVQQNIVHGSDSPTSAAREISIWFPELQE